MAICTNMKAIKIFHGNINCKSFVKGGKRAKIRNRYNQATHLPRIPMGGDKVTIKHHKREPRGQPFSQQVTTKHQQTDVHESITKQDRNNINDPQKKHRLGTVSKSILLEGFNRFNGALTSPLVQMWIKTHRCLICTKDP